MSIQQGDPIPPAKVFEIDDHGGPRAVSAAERFAGKRVVLFAVPGAFTRTCSQVHLPSFVQNAEAIKAKGIDEIVCLAVNDAAVLTAWAREHGATGKISMVSDGLGEFTRAIGLDQDSSREPAGRVTAASIQTHHRRDWCRPVLKAGCWASCRGSSA
jgi:glutaredoxin/glutathione-dependent peroxiredoxin